MAPRHEKTQFTPQEEADLVQLLRRQRETEASDQRYKVEDRVIARTELFIKLAKWFGSVIVIVCVWVLGVNWGLLSHGKEIDKLVIRADAQDKAFAALDKRLDVVNVALDKRIDTLIGQVDHNRTERVNSFQAITETISRHEKMLEEIEPKVTRMDILREMGRTNKDDFQQRNGYPPTK